MKRIKKQPLQNFACCLFAIVPIAIILVGACPNGAFGFTYEFHGELAGWVTFEPDRDDEISVGLRYIPALTFEQQLTEAIRIDSEMSINAYETGRFDTPESGEYHGKLKPYRAWLRSATAQLELRAGLQKINFGSATLLRPLMWFDRIDPRDPLQLTDGVYSVLGRYYFLNNANIWLWGLYGNDETKGWETDITDDDHPEFGGRIQTPLSTGELAFSFHHRKALVEGDQDGSPRPSSTSVPENRVGIDGKWDMGVGFWFEGVLIHQDSDTLNAPYRRFLNIGVDYTFDWGNGVNVIVEHLVAAATEKPLGTGKKSTISALSISYPLGLIDRISTILNFDWETHRWFRYAAWQRTYDNWNFYLMGFLNPSEVQLFGENNERPEINGNGVRIMVVYNH